MKYKPILPKENSNVSHVHPLKELLTLLTGLVVLVLVVYGLLGIFVDIAVDYISPEMERATYQSIEVYQQEPTNIPVSEAEQAAQTLLNKLAQCIDIGYPVSLRIDESPALNAFALPGGQVVLLSGLLDKINSQNGLAFVLAHELAHFKNRDHLRSTGRGVVLLALSILITGSNSDLTKILAPITNFEAAHFSQERESAADVAALDAINCHYGHVGGATEFFEAIAKPDDNFNLSLTHYFSTHPEVQDRIDAIQALGISKGYKINQTIDKSISKP